MIQPFSKSMLVHFPTALQQFVHFVTAFFDVFFLFFQRAPYFRLFSVHSLFYGDALILSQNWPAPTMSILTCFTNNHIILESLQKAPPNPVGSGLPLEAPSKFSLRNTIGGGV
jgi:hypothetical protein